jgi:hypothetical protein
MIRHLPIALILLLIVATLPVYCVLLGAHPVVQATAQDQAVGTDRASERCDELHERGPDFEQLANACQYAVTAPHTLPDFVCTETVKQYLSPSAKPQVITAELTIEKTRSHYSAVAVNGKIRPTRGEGGDAVFEGLVGSTGEFAMLFNIFDPSSQAEFAPPAAVTLEHRRLKRFDFRVKRENNLRWTWLFADAALNPGYHGSLFVDAASGEIFRLLVQVNSAEVDPETPVSEATTTVDYADVSIAGAGTHHLPVRGENISCFRTLKGCTRAELTFSNFHKFGSTVRIVPGS